MMKPESEALSRLEEARATKRSLEDDFKEAYFFTAPHRRAPNSSTVGKPGQGEDYGSERAAELRTSHGFEVATDFATVLLNTFVPQSEQWAELGPGPGVQKGEIEQVKRDVAEVNENVFTAIRASNFYAEFAKSTDPDACIGTVAMWVNDSAASKPIECLSAPISELDLSLGPNGLIDDRFVTRQTKYRHIAALLPGIELPEKIQRKQKEKGGDSCKVIWGYWRDWSKPDETWVHVVLVDKEEVHRTEVVGDGSCPLVVGRFNATADMPWGYGPMLKCLPDMRQLDELSALKIEAIDFGIRPPFGFPEDSIAGLANGVEAGMAYPVRPGQEGAIKEFFRAGNVEPAMYEIQELERRVRKLHFVDYPEQMGKTPPSATQWAGEMENAQRRIGTPGLSFFAEFCVGIFKRFQYLLQKRGVIREVIVNGSRIAVYPQNPAQRAADMQKLSNGLRLLEAGGGLFPEEMKARVDGVKTLQNMQGLLRDKMVEFRSQEDLSNAVDMIAKLQGGEVPQLGASQQPGMPA